VAVRADAVRLYARLSLVRSGRYFANSVLVAVTTTALVVFISSCAGYCYRSLGFVGRGSFFAVVLRMMVP